MRRRHFIVGLSSTASALAFVAHAQQPKKLPTIGLLGQSTRAAASEWVAAFAERLREHGWIEGRTIAIEYRWSEGRDERSADIAAEFVRLKVDIIVTSGTSHVLAAKQATSAIPIVFATAGDPVATGLVSSLARPGGNATGLATLADDLAGKRLELLRQALPGLRRLATISDISNPWATLELSKIKDAARALGIEVTSFEVGRGGEIDSVFDAMKGRTDALYVLAVPLLFANRVRISSLALGARLPTVCLYREYVEAGALMSYGANWPSMWRHAADLEDKILRGAKPAELPIEQPTEFDLVINLTTAKVLGLEVPLQLQQLANEVIE